MAVHAIRFARLIVQHEQLRSDEKEKSDRLKAYTNRLDGRYHSDPIIAAYNDAGLDVHLDVRETSTALTITPPNSGYTFSKIFPNKIFDGSLDDTVTKTLHNVFKSLKIYVAELEAQRRVEKLPILNRLAHAIDNWWRDHSPFIKKTTQDPDLIPKEQLYGVQKISPQILSTKEYRY